MLNLKTTALSARRHGRSLVLVSALATAASIYTLHSLHADDAKPVVAEAKPVLKLEKGDHIAILGNVLPDRMQFDGWLETLIAARFPKDELVFRNLSAAGDEVNTWHRSQDFGSRDQWLGKVQADVIFAFYGFNESFKGVAGLPEFRQELEKFIKETQGKNYNGKGAPKLVLFSPALNEKNPDPNFPDPTAVNANIELYAAAMAEVAKANNVLFVDLVGPSKTIFSQSSKDGRALTVNGHYLTDEADKLLAPMIFREIFSESAPTGDMEKLRTAINDKNWEWHTRYRTIDGYNVYGGRSHESYASGKGKGPKITNNKVMQEEMTQRDVMTANRDKRVWAVAQGGDLQVDDSNLPPVTNVGTNYPGSNPDGSWNYTDPEQAIAQMKVAKGCKVNLFASEKDFPELVNPLQMAWDTKGRLWVSVWHNYPERTPTSKVGDSILIFEDPQHTGHATKCIHFIDDLNAPTGFQFFKDGILLMQAPDVWFVKSTDGSDHANYKERVLMGMDSADSHHTTNAMCYEPGGAVYLSDGVFHRTQVETADGAIRNHDAGIFRFDPHTGEFERYAPYGFANPHGRVFDYWGNDLITDATGNNTYFGPAISGHIDFPGTHPGIKQFWDRPSRPCPGTGILTSRAFPPEFQNNFLNCNVIGFQGIYRVKVTEQGSGLHGETLENLVELKDPDFRPSQVNVGPEGAVYFSDWSNVIIGHLQHHLRDENRGHAHGRIYRMVYEGMPLMTPAKIDGQPIPALLNLLKEPENQTRTLAKIELDKHPAAEVVAGVKAWIETLDKNDPAYEHHMTEALWVHQWVNVVDVDLLKRVLRSPEPRARAAATRVLSYWRNRVPGAIDLVKTQAQDEDARVRLQAIRAASFFTGVEAADAALASLKYPEDFYISYVMKETMKQLEKYWHGALAAGKPIAMDNPAGMNFLVGSINTAELLKLPHTGGVLQMALSRPDVPDATRTSLLNELAAAKKVSTLQVVLESLPGEKHGSPSEAALARLLPAQPATDLAAAREKLIGLAVDGSSAEVRQPAWAAVATADQSLDKAWDQASKKPAQLTDLLLGIPFIFDTDIRNHVYDRVKPLLAPEMPAALVNGADASALREAAIRAAVSMSAEQKATFSSLAALVIKGEAVVPAARGIRSLPRAVWDKSQAGPLANALVTWAKGLKSDARTSQEYAETVQFAGDLAGMLPDEQAAALRKDLKELRVSVFVVRTVREQMRYDTPRLVVQTGKPFQIILENGDMMQHNLAIVKPGTRVKLAEVAGKMSPDALDKEGRAFMPNSPDILAATKLVDPGQNTKLKMTAPTEPGEYEYFCTYPNHSEIMRGMLVVADDVDSYLAAHPDAAPAPKK